MNVFCTVCKSHSSTTYNYNRRTIVPSVCEMNQHNIPPIALNWRLHCIYLPAVVCVCVVGAHCVQQCCTVFRPETSNANPVSVAAYGDAFFVAQLATNAPKGGGRSSHRQVGATARSIGHRAHTETVHMPPHTKATNVGRRVSVSFSMVTIKPKNNMHAHSTQLVLNARKYTARSSRERMAKDAVVVVVVVGADRCAIFKPQHRIVVIFVHCVRAQRRQRRRRL